MTPPTTSKNSSGRKQKSVHTAVNTRVLLKLLPPRMRNSCNEAPPHPPLNPNGCKTPNACWSGGGLESLNYFILIIYLIGCSNLLRVIFCYFFLLKKVTPRITPAAESLQLGSAWSARIGWLGRDRIGTDRARIGRTGTDRSDRSARLGSVGSDGIGSARSDRSGSL